MSDINMIQIHELNEASSVAATDVLAIDTGDATLKLKASKLTTGVKGNAESSYRTGNVNLTPANIGAMPSNPASIELSPTSQSHGGFIDFHFAGSSADYTSRIIESASGTLSIPGALALGSPLGIPSGGTGATTAAAARTNLGITPANIGAVANPGSSSQRYETGSVDDAPVGFSFWSRDTTNAPFTFWATVFTIVGNPSSYKQQIAVSWANGDNQLAIRKCDGGTWYAWKYVTLS